MPPTLALSPCDGRGADIQFSLSHDPPKQLGWAIRSGIRHGEWHRSGPLGYCDRLWSADYEPHHKALHKAGWLSRMPYLSRKECNSRSVPWLSGVEPPQSIVAYWGWSGTSATGAAPVLVMPLGSVLHSEERLLYVPHPEYHAPPECLPDAQSAQHVPRAINLLQAYGSNYWHLVAEILPRLLTVSAVFPE